MQNIFSQQKVLENTDNFTYFANNLNTNFNLIQTWSFNPVKTSSWIIFKRWQYFGEWGFSYIWTEKIDKIYCLSGSENTLTNHIYIKNFIPFEEQWEDIFDDYEEILTTTSWIYTSYQKEHVIKDTSWNIIVWKWIFWDKFSEWANWDNIYLNSPTWLAQNWGNLYISDTLNNRILYLDSSNKIHLLLDEYDWLNEPTWLYYNNNKLYISNSWNWKILKYSSKNIWTNPTLTMSWFSENINEIYISFSWSNTPNLSNLWNWSVAWNSSTPNYLTWTTDKLKYYFITKNSESIQPTCTWTETKFTNWKPSLYCTKTWSWQTANYPTSTISKIEIPNLSWLTNTWSYYVNLQLFDWTTEKYSWYFPYFTQWDDDLTTKDDNILTVYKSWLNYPTWIWWTAIWQINQFWNPPYSDLDYHKTDILLWTPIKSLDITNSSDNLISLFLKYYNRYNCYNLDDNAQRSFLLKKNLK